MLTAQDERLEALSRWLEGQTAVTGLDLTTVTAASADASFRRYFRVQGEGATYIVMDAPPEKEPIDSFLKVDALMKNAGLNVPEILARDAEQGFILMSDLGRQTYLDVLNEDNAARLKELNLAPIVIDEITVLGSRCGQFPPALRLLKNKRIDFTPFISGIYSIDDAIEAFEANKDKESIKILIKM